MKRISSALRKCSRKPSLISLCSKQVRIIACSIKFRMYILTSFSNTSFGLNLEQEVPDDTWAILDTSADGHNIEPPFLAVRRYIDSKRLDYITDVSQNDLYSTQISLFVKSQENTHYRLTLCSTSHNFLLRLNWFSRMSPSPKDMSSSPPPSPATIHPRCWVAVSSP